MNPDLKIVCIINIEGLINAIGGDDYNSNFCRNYILHLEQSLFISNRQVSAIPIENWDIVLCNDVSVPFSDNTIFHKDYSLVMYHQTPENTLAMLEGRVRKPKLGCHENAEILGYPLLKYLFQAWDDENKTFREDEYEQAKNKLIDWFDLNEKLNKALDYLHNSLGGTMVDASILMSGEDKFDFDTCKYNDKSLRDLIDGPAGKTNGELFEALKGVRDALLEQAG